MKRTSKKAWRDLTSARPSEAQMGMVLYLYYRSTDGILNFPINQIRELKYTAFILQSFKLVGVCRYCWSMNQLGSLCNMTGAAFVEIHWVLVLGAAVHYANIVCKPRCHFCDRITIPLQPVQPRKLPSSSPPPPIHQASRRAIGCACIYGTSCK